MEPKVLTWLDYTLYARGYAVHSVVLPTRFQGAPTDARVSFPLGAVTSRFEAAQELDELVGGNLCLHQVAIGLVFYVGADIVALF